MKTYLYIFLTFSLSLFMSCNASQNNTKQEAHQHKDGDNHDHANETDHEHSEDDGHDHGSKSSDENHSDEIVLTQSQAKAVDLKTETLQTQPFSYIIKTSGQIQAPQGDEQTVVATTAGIVSFTNASITDGTAIRAGETLVTISAKNLQNGDPALRAKIEFETAEKEYKRAEELAVDKIISAKQFEQTRLAYENAKNAYQAQAGNITASGIRVASPISGYIKNRMVNQGEYVSVGQAIATVAQNRRLQLRAEISENYFKYLKSISSANFRTAYDNSTYKLSDLNGKLISYGKTSGNSSFYIPVTFEFDNIGDIIPGSFTEVYLLSTVRDNVLSVPLTALTEEQGLHFVYIRTEPEAYIKKEVTIGQNDGERVEIIKGLNAGDNVVTQGVTQVKLASASGAIPDGHNH